VSEWVFFFVAGELLMAGAFRLYEEMRAEREDGRLPPGVYRIVWGV
jgi:hypothetical protein